MTREQILALSGRELAEAVAVRVMGETVYPDRGPWNAGGVKPYDSDIAWAWDVEEEIRRRASTCEGLAHEYARHLRSLSSQACLASEPGETSLGLDWETLHAPPDRRCRAALLAMCGEAGA